MKLLLLILLFLGSNCYAQKFSEGKRFPSITDNGNNVNLNVGSVTLPSQTTFFFNIPGSGFSFVEASATGKCFWQDTDVPPLVIFSSGFGVMTTSNVTTPQPEFTQQNVPFLNQLSPKMIWVEAETSYCDNQGLNSDTLRLYIANDAGATTSTSRSKLESQVMVNNGTTTNKRSIPIFLDSNADFWASCGHINGAGAAAISSCTMKVEAVCY